MKFKNILLVAALAGLFSLSSQAQDLFSVPRAVVLTAPAKLTGTTTNNAVDLFGFIGKVQAKFVCVTNAGDAAGSITAIIDSSPDQTNWTAVANYGNASSTTAIYTNFYYGATNFTATNTYLLPGTVTTPTASSGGFATSYLAPPPFTNSAAITLTGGGVKMIGFNVNDQAGRYFRVRWTSGAPTNFVGYAELTGVRGSEVIPISP